MLTATGTPGSRPSKNRLSTTRNSSTYFQIDQTTNAIKLIVVVRGNSFFDIRYLSLPTFFSSTSTLPLPPPHLHINRRRRARTPRTRSRSTHTKTTSTTSNTCTWYSAAKRVVRRTHQHRFVSSPATESQPHTYFLYVSTNRGEHFMLPPPLLDPDPPICSVWHRKTGYHRTSRGPCIESL